MKSVQGRTILAACAAFLLAACAARAPDFGGRWKPVNRYADATQAIPLQQAYVFAASPMDGTLRNMLARWARDAHLALEWRHPSDYTLHSAVAGIHTADVREAAALVTAAFAPQRLEAVVEGNRIVVRATDAPAPGAHASAQDAPPDPTPAGMDAR
jgi:hypothetical protein